MTYVMDFKRTYEELNVLLPFSPDVKVQQVQHEKMAVMSFLADLPPKFKTAKSHILSSSEILSLQDIFTKVLHKEITIFVPLSSQPNSALVSRSNVNEPEHLYNKNNNKGGGTSNNDNRSQNSAITVMTRAIPSASTENYKIDPRSLIQPML